MDAFKEGTRLGVTIPTAKGVLTIVQSWGLDLPEVQEALLASRTKLKKLSVDDDTELSFLISRGPAKDVQEEIRFAILKEIYIYKKEAAENALNKRRADEHNQKVLAEMQRRADNKLSTMTDEDLAKSLVK
jgi:hypothetical protein